MKIRQFQVDAFACRRFEGNPAAVCPLDSWLDDSLMQAIAAENNLSETAFFVPTGDRFACAGLPRSSRSIFAATRRWLLPMCCSNTSVTTNRPSLLKHAAGDSVSNGKIISYR